MSAVITSQLLTYHCLYPWTSVLALSTCKQSQAICMSNIRVHYTSNFTLHCISDDSWDLAEPTIRSWLHHTPHI